MTPIFIDQVVDTTSTLSDTGIKITIPANSAYCVSATARYNASPPKGISLRPFKDGSEDNTYFSAQNDSDSDRISVSATGYTNKTIDFTVMARYTNASGRNRILVSGFYVNANVIDPVNS